MEDKDKQKEESVILSIRINGEYRVFVDLLIKYIWFSHEHVSYGPDQPFAATTGVYQFEITEESIKNKYTIYQDKDEIPQPIELRKYFVILLSVEEDQNVVKLQIVKK